MQSILTFLSGSALVVLLLVYLGTVVPNTKRWIGTVLSLLAAALFIWAFAEFGMKKGIDLQGGSSFMVQLQPGMDADGKPTKLVTKSSVDQAMGILEKRLNPDGAKDMQMVPTGSDRIEVQMPGIKDEEIASVRQKIEQVAHLEFRLVDPQNPESLTEAEATSKQRIGYEKLVDKDRVAADAKEKRYMLVTNRANMDGKYVKQAFAQLDPSKGWIIMVRFDSEGEKLFGELTSAHVHERLAVVVDNEIISAPNINSAIYGTCEISGSFTEQSARSLASALENPLENPMKILQSGTVSSAFGAATIQQGMLAGIVGLALTALFLLIYYRTFGLLSYAGLAVSLLAVIGAMALFQFTLTMPGIAGLVLTIAMAVDANVLIFERLREELRAGKSLLAAMDSAHDRAFTAIFDAHVTTLITSLILMAMATAMLKGFAITMIIGVFSTLLGALIVTRVALHWFVDTGIITKVKMTEIIPNRTFNVMKYGLHFVLFSTAVCVIAIAAMVAKGEHSFGIDYRGGAKISFKVAQGKTLTAPEVESALKGLQLTKDGQKKDIGQAYVQGSHTAGGDEMITVRSEEYAGPAIQNKIQETFKDRINGVTLDTVQAVVGGELASRSAWAVVLALLGIFFYLYFRYEFSFALGALVSLVHDCIIVLGFSVLLGQELSLVHIGAVLTVAGYSVNDTIIVFDRVREIIRTRTGTITELLNEAISITFSRTILTSLVTFIPMAVLYFFGGPAMREFSLPIVIGVVIGTYSSVFVACPIVLWHARRTGQSLHKQLLTEEEHQKLGGSTVA